MRCSSFPPCSMYVRANVYLALQSNFFFWIRLDIHYTAQYGPQKINLCFPVLLTFVSVRFIALQDLERHADAPWFILPYQEQRYYYPDRDFGSYHGVHDKGDPDSRCVPRVRAMRNPRGGRGDCREQNTDKQKVPEKWLTRMLILYRFCSMHAYTSR